MDNLAELFNAFYTHFVLRDLLAKITPGAIVLVAISTIFIWQPDDVAHYLAELTFWSWTIFLAFSWITGITLQSIGEWFDKIFKGKFGFRSFPKEISDDKEWFDFHIKFAKSVRVSKVNKNRVERFAVIKEASGIGSIAFLIVSILLFVKISLLLPEAVPLLFCLIGFALIFKPLFELLYLIMICWTAFKEPLIFPFIQDYLGVIYAKLRLEDFLVLGGYDNIGILLMRLIIAIIFLCSLTRSHKKHVQRQYEYMRVAMDC